MAKKSNASSRHDAVELQGSKSTALGPMIWLIVALIAALTGSYFKAPTWVTASLLAMLSISVVCYIGLNIYFGIVKPELLRSE